MCVHNSFFFFVQINNLFCTVITESARELFVVTHCGLLNITNARTPHERGARLHQIGTIGLNPAMVLRKI